MRKQQIAFDYHWSGKNYFLFQTENNNKKWFESGSTEKVTTSKQLTKNKNSWRICVDTVDSFCECALKNTEFVLLFVTVNASTDVFCK